MKTKQKKGFTLIEIMVVIAILGILMAVSLVLLSGPSKLASDNSVKANLLSIRKQSEIYYITNNNYGVQISSCNTGVFGDPTVLSALDEIRDNIDGNKQIICTTSVSGSTWAISVNKLRKANTTWCVDSTGNSKSNSTSASGSCN